uniref:Chlorophyll a-b binding protein, chloroplastic n=1 Tax=Panagrolaimus sp. JU765 TaxID=591449 RepID=A0AC34QCM8_9BILA
MADEEFSKPTYKCGTYENPKSFVNWLGLPGISDVLWWKFFSSKAPLPGKQELETELPITKPNFDEQLGLVMPLWWFG